MLVPERTHLGLYIPLKCNKNTMQEDTFRIFSLFSASDRHNYFTHFFGSEDIWDSPVHTTDLVEYSPGFDERQKNLRRKIFCGSHVTTGKMVESLCESVDSVAHRDTPPVMDA